MFFTSPLQLVQEASQRTDNGKLKLEINEASFWTQGWCDVNGLRGSEGSSEAAVDDLLWFL